MRKISAFLFVMAGFASFAQDPVLLTINDSVKVTKSEFERTYRKNNNISLNSGVKSKDEYLQLFINYKLKVLEAMSMKLDTAKKFRTEYEGYVKQLSEPYLVDTNIDNKVIQEIYDRLKYQVRSSHILVKVSLDASPKDSLDAYNKALSLRGKILKGEPFDSVAKYNSDDPSAKQNFGDLGYMTVLNLVYEYENAMYTLPVGEISMPVRTQFGYHIIKVVDKQPAPGQFKMAHILVAARSKNTKDTLDNTKLKAKIDSAYNELQKGVPFGKVAARYSEDPRTKDKGGDFGWVGPKQRFPKTFKDFAYLTKTGEYTKPFQTEYGWHIIKILEKRASAPFEEELPGIKDRIKRDQNRNQKGKLALINRLKKEYNYQENKKNLDAFIAKIDTTILWGQWKIGDKKFTKNVLFTFANQSFNESDFAHEIKLYQQPIKKAVTVSIPFLVENMFKLVVEHRIIEYETSVLGNKYPEFRYLSQEYHDGMLLFDLTDKTIWNRTASDEQGINTYYNDNPTKYMWGERAEASIFTCKDAKTADKLVALLRNKAKSKQTDSIILKTINKKDTLVKREVKLVEKGDDETIDKLEWKTGSVKKTSDLIVYEVNRIVAPGRKLLSECRGQVIADFQKQLEDQWIASLRMKYKVTVNNDVLNSVQE